MKIMAFGKNLSGELLFKPMDEQQFVNILAAALPRNAAALRSLADITTRGVSFRGEVVKQVIDAGDPRKAGWTFMVADHDPQKDHIMQILEPLAAHRGMEDPSAPLVFGGEPEDTWGEWLAANFYARLLEGKKAPQYVLMMGGPDLLPFRFQSLLDTVVNVGRLEFDTLHDLKQYVEKIIRLETAPDPLVKREVVLFAPDGGMQDPTFFSREYLVKPLNQHITQELDFKTVPLLGPEATKKKLADALRGAKPALIFTASHGLGLMGEPLEQQKRLNGAICCQAAGQLTMQDLFCADDVPMDEPFLEGSVFFQFACFGYGTPAWSDYTHWLEDIPKKYAEVDFVASLPKRLLAHPRGPIAYVGHLDTAFLHGFTDQNDPYLMERWHARIEPFVFAVKQLLEVQPSGLSMQHMNERFGIYNVLLNSIYDKVKRRDYTWTPERKRSFVDKWILRSDAQNYMVFGDPAARLRIPA